MQTYLSLQCKGQEVDKSASLVWCIAIYPATARTLQSFCGELALRLTLQGREHDEMLAFFILLPG